MENNDSANQLILRLEEEGFMPNENYDGSYSNLFSKQINKDRVILFFIEGNKNTIALTQAIDTDESASFYMFIKFGKSSIHNITNYLNQIIDFSCEYKATEQDVGIVWFELSDDSDSIIFEEINGDRNRVLVLYKDTNGKHYLFSKIGESVSITNTANNK